MVGSFGLAGPTPVVYLEPARDRSRLLAFTMVRKAVEHALSEAAKSCKAMIENHRGSIEALALRPAERGRVDDADVAEMIALAEHLALLVSLAGEISGQSDLAAGLTCKRASFRSTRKPRAALALFGFHRDRSYAGRRWVTCVSVDDEQPSRERRYDCGLCQPSCPANGRQSEVIELFA